MIILKDIEIENYKNIKHSYLKDLEGLNILIGPNNCGKTNFLRAINLITKLEVGTDIGYSNTDDCRNIQNSWNTRGAPQYKVAGIKCNTKEDDKYLRKNKFKIIYDFEVPYLENSLKLLNLEVSFSSFGTKLKNSVDRADYNKSIQQIMNMHINQLGFNGNHNPITTPNKLILKQLTDNNAAMEHISLFSIEKLTKNIQDNIKFIEDNRLKTYKNRSLKVYIKEKNLSGNNITKLINFVGKIVDPKIKDYKQDSLELIKEPNFITSIEEQGSGVRSVICLAVDILSMEKESIVLIDEPELGLNPFAKQELLKLLIEESKTKQIFITTQDPTFVNPILWNKKDVAVYLYSLVEEKFVKIDLLHKNKDDYSTFGGFLPHTTSLKDIHIYVEGPSDVYIFQILLTKYFKKYFKNKSLQMLNRIQIYNLGGDFWEHLLCTIPKPPYKCLVILDGDKQELCKEVCKKYEKSGVNTSKFKYYKNIESTKMFFNNEKRVWPINEQEKHSIICLKKDCIEKYFNPNFDCKNPPENYNKIIDGIKKAEEIKEIPEELKKIFDYTFCVTDKNIK